MSKTALSAARVPAAQLWLLPDRWGVCHRANVQLFTRPRCQNQGPSDTHGGSAASRDPAVSDTVRGSRLGNPWRYAQPLRPFHKTRVEFHPQNCHSRTKELGTALQAWGHRLLCLLRCSDTGINMYCVFSLMFHTLGWTNNERSTLIQKRKIECGYL